MSYTVFALTWRPKVFSEIVGQSHIVTQLTQAIQKDRLAHAFLFAGPRGVGKTSTARILAKALNCKNGPTVSPCGVCPACLDIANARSFDVIEIDGASNRGIDEIRTLRENVKFAPTNGKFKVYIIDEVHQITTDGFNALLKTLEEPPEFVKFIFATTQPQKVPPTILSRCQRLDFRRIPVMEIIGQLKKIAAVEHIKAADDVLTAIARASDGALRDAESILDQLVAFSKGSVTLADVVSMLGQVEQQTLFELTDAVVHKDASRALALVNNIIDRGKDTAVLLQDLIEHFRNLMVAKVAQGDSGLIDLPQELCVRLAGQAGGLSLEEIFGAFNALVSAQDLAKRLESARIPIEITLVKLCAGTRTAESQRPASMQARSLAQTARPVAAAYKPQAAVAQKPAAKPAPVQEPIEQKPQAPPAAGLDRHEAAVAQPDSRQTAVAEAVWPPREPAVSVSLDAIKDSWHAVVQNMSKVKIFMANYLKEGIPSKIQNNMLYITFHKNHSLYKETLEKKENREMVEKAIEDSLHAPLKVHFVLSQEEKAHDDTSDHPVVQSALDMFNARLIREG